jgi:hypothetical protein
MMDLSQQIDALAVAGSFFRQVGTPQADNSRLNKTCRKQVEHLVNTAYQYNAWFTAEFVVKAFHCWGEVLTKEKLDHWLAPYHIPEKETVKPKKIAVVMAGNIPLVGFHDMLCVLLSGHRFVGKMSSKDNRLFSAVADILVSLCPEYRQRIEWVDSTLEGFDAVIATGSNNSARYFRYYFSKYPHIIRHNRNSVAVITGNETRKDLVKLADDLFLYFGLGCRNVSRLFVPAGYDFTAFFKAVSSYAFLTDHFKYANNYEYRKTIFLLNNIDHLDNGFVLLKKDADFYSPIGTVFYDEYHTFDEVNGILAANEEKVQCVVSVDKRVKGCIMPGQTQKPALGEYADNTDTLRFLLKI